MKAHVGTDTEKIWRAIARLSDALTDVATKFNFGENDGVLREVERG